MSDYYSEQQQRLQEQHLNALNSMARNQRIEGMESQFAGSNTSGFLIKPKGMSPEAQKALQDVDFHLKRYNYQNAARRAAAAGYDPHDAAMFGRNAVALASGVGMMVLVYLMTGLTATIGGWNMMGQWKHDIQFVWYGLDVFFVHWCLFVTVRAMFIAVRVPAAYQTESQNRKVRMRYLLLPLFLYWPVHIFLILIREW